MSGETADAEVTFLEALVRKNPNFVDALIPLAEMYTQKGLYEKGLVIDKRLAQLKKEDPVVHYNLACSFALLEQTTEALTALARAISLGYSDFEHMQRDRDLKNLHDHPEFRKLIS
ncbi:MAG: hypothetical protein A3G87_00880 [Omnitrophica bacterium RIFCSPLOWO2_12_FULL_50_11]|nr:MAG: hypothetical protein A3G87_00880 [Omnitrophica bacterium RIFCSPLOWO2_12_FULL_50_11]